jgi:hypothetical protein
VERFDTAVLRTVRHCAGVGVLWSVVTLRYKEHRQVAAERASNARYDSVRLQYFRGSLRLLSCIKSSLILCR